MEAINLLTGYVDKLKASEKLLKQLERKAKALSQKQAETEEQRLYLEATITDHKRDTASLLSERQDLQLAYMQAVYEQQASTQRNVQSRRVEIDTELEQHEQAIQELDELLDGLEDFAEESGELAAQLDALYFGNGSTFANSLREALVKNEAALKSRQTDARSNLPDFDQDTYHEYRLEHDEMYRQQKAGEELQARQIAYRVAENEKRYGKPGHVPKQAVVNDDGYIVGYR